MRPGGWFSPPGIFRRTPAMKLPNLALFLAVVPALAHAQTAGVTVRSALQETLALRPAPRTSTIEDVLALVNSEERGSKVLLTCAVTLESLQNAFGGKSGKVRKFVRKWPTGFEITFNRLASIPIGNNFSGTITAKPSEMKARASLDVQFMWHLYAQTTGGTQFLEGTADGGSQRAGICVQPATMPKDQRHEFRLGYANRRTPQAVLRPLDEKNAALGPSLWSYTAAGEDSLFCEFNEAISQYQRHGLELVCDYGSHSRR